MSQIDLFGNIGIELEYLKPYNFVQTNDLIGIVTLNHGCV